jgi:hypothetical protein
MQIYVKKSIRDSRPAMQESRRLKGNGPVLSRFPNPALDLIPRSLRRQPYAHLVINSPGIPSLSRLVFYLVTRSKDSPRTDPPVIEFRTFLLKVSLLFFKSSAASLLRGSEAFGSRKRN